jgi:amino acid adenylation domain-containing protein
MVQISNSTIASLFCSQASDTPDEIALIVGEEKLTYGELDARSNALASELRRRGVGAESLVGVALKRTPSLVVSLLAILKAGGAYVPLDPKYPKDRLAWIIDDSRMRLLLTTQEVMEALPLAHRELQTLDVSVLDFQLGTEGGLTQSEPADTSLAYVMYTSGSTGRPKGVMIEHRNVTNFFAGMDRVLGSTRGVWLAVTSVCFDISVLELLWTLARGFTVVVQSEDQLDNLAPAMIKHRVTHLQMTPSLARILMLDPHIKPAFRSLKQILLGGEAVPVSLVREMRQITDAAIYNMYGPTETTIWSTAGLVSDLSTSTIPIGEPILNTEIHILDENLRLVHNGGIGEIFIGGDGVARGYWGRPDLTAERFLTIPQVSCDRLYRTGDLGRFLPDGNLEYLGRTDFQVKLRGHRIELGEIEALLEKCEGVRQAIVVLREDRQDDKRLVAYLVASGAAEPSPQGLRGALESSLPDFMVPSHFVFLSQLPLTANGKIDRKAILNLPPPSIASAKPGAGPSAKHQGDSNSDPIEEQIREWFQDLLGASDVSEDDDFFALGGHSLVGIRLLSKIRSSYGIQMHLASLLHTRTVRAIAAAVRDAKANAGSSKEKALVPIQPNGNKPPIFLIHAVGGDVLFYEPLAAALGDEQPVFAFRSPLSYQRQMRESSVAEQAQAFVREMQSFYPYGPYFIAGHSYGGVLAFEMARQLYGLGLTPELLVLIDSDLPGSTTQLPLRTQLATLVQNLRNEGMRYLARKSALKFGYLTEVFVHRLQLTAAALMEMVGRPLPLTLRYARIEEIHYRALARYRPQPYTGKTWLVRAVQRGFKGIVSLSQVDDPTLGWSEFAHGGLEIEDVVAEHRNILLAPHAAEIAEKIKLMISQLETNSQRS